MGSPGRGVPADEAYRMGLVHRVVPVGQSRQAAEEWAHELALLPQTCLRQDRLSLLEQEGLDEEEALAVEFRHGMVSLPEAGAGGARFTAGGGRPGAAV